MRLDFCALCGERDISTLEHHHFRPRALGGTDDEKNLFTVCGNCHGEIHDIPRPLRLGELVKKGQEQAKDRAWHQIDELAQAAAAGAERLRELARQRQKIEAEEKVKLRREQKILLYRPAPRYRAPPPPIQRIDPQRPPEMKITTRLMAESGDWSVATDGIQWILQRRRGDLRCGISFVHSTRDVLAGCMREKGVPEKDAQRLLEACPIRFEPLPASQGPPDEENVLNQRAVA